MIFKKKYVRNFDYLLHFTLVADFYLEKILEEFEKNSYFSEIWINTCIQRMLIEKNTGNSFPVSNCLEWLKFVEFTGLLPSQ